MKKDHCFCHQKFYGKQPEPDSKVKCLKEACSTYRKNNEGTHLKK